MILNSKSLKKVKFNDSSISHIYEQKSVLRKLGQASSRQLEYGMQI